MSTSTCHLSSRLCIPIAKMRLKYGKVAYGLIEDTVQSTARKDWRRTVVLPPRKKEEEEGGGGVKVCSICVVVLPSPPSEQ
jgi:hypothetical protein